MPTLATLTLFRSLFRVIVIATCVIIGTSGYVTVADDGGLATSAENDRDGEGKKKKGRKPRTDSTRKRLQAIEKKLEALTKHLESLTKSSPEPKSTSEKTTADKPQQPAATVAQPRPPSKRPTSVKLDPRWLKDIPCRPIGPANMAGRVTDLVVHDRDPSLWWIATASGGLLKTNNQGITVEHQFDHEATVSIGCIAADPKNKEVLWIGTGEANPRNSVSYGDGVYKSTDGGKSWKNMGLRKSFQIGRILIHPQQTDTVYVGALGRLYGPNRERGVFRTTNGGESWEQVLYVDDNTGVIDMIMHPAEPDTIIAALWDRTRDGFDSWPGSVKREEGIDNYDPIRKWGPGGGLYKTTDGGGTWKKLSSGLPSGMTGRIGLDWQLKSPHTIYAIIDCEDIGKGPEPFDAFLGVTGTNVDGIAVISQLLPDSPAAKARMRVGDILKQADATDISEFDQLLDVLRKKKPGERISLTLQRGDRELKVSTKLTGRPGSPQQAPQVWLGVSGEDRDGKIVLTNVVDGGPSAKAGLKTGDTIIRFNGKKPKDYAQLIATVRDMATGDKVKLIAGRRERTSTRSSPLQSAPDSVVHSRAATRSWEFRGRTRKAAARRSRALRTVARPRKRA